MASLTYQEAAHLLRRMAFCGPPEEINNLVARGREGAVDYLINYELIDNSEMEKSLDAKLAVKRFFNVLHPIEWWIARMALTRRPFEEKMTLFWHNHFATAITKVPFDLMYLQNVTLRANALARFDTLLLKVSQDPAMLLWLDGITNILGRQNENFAREIQELFTMGINDVVTGEANYTEKDVKEIARAFSGWRFLYPSSPKLKKPKKYKFFVEPSLHDNGAKEIYGRTANFSGEDVVTIICARRATARFLVTKFFEFFVYPLTASDEDKATIEKFATVYINGDHSIKTLARAIFTSDEFFSDRARFALVKNPVELIIGAIRMLGASYNHTTLEENNYPILARLANMGLFLMNPPDVNGWELNLGWLNTARMLERYNFGTYFTSFRNANPDLPGAWITEAQLRRHTEASAQATVERLLFVLGPLEVDAEIKRALIDYLQTDDQGNTVEFAPTPQAIDKLVRGLVFLIMCTPEFQLN